MSSLAEATIGVVTGGVSQERDRSLLSGDAVNEALLRMGYQTIVIDAADQDLVDQLKNVDIAFLAIAGQYAEDGRLQGFLETLRIPYTGSGVLASALGMNKTALKQFVGALGVPVLDHIEPRSSDSIETIIKQAAEHLGFPLIVKPVSEGGSIGISIVKEEDELQRTLQPLTQNHDREFFIEKYCSGRTVTVGVLDGNSGPHATPILEVKTAGEFYDYHTKRNPALHSYECPANLEMSIAEQLADFAVIVHRAINCTGYSRSDFIVSEFGDVYFLEVNTLPGLSRKGNIATMANAAGISYEDLILRILQSATTKKR